jgi:preprotein translocase subunit SecA
MLNLDHLKAGSGLRGWGQKTPLIEYKKEAFAMFQDMMEFVRRDIIHHIFHLKLERFNHHELERKRERELDQLSLSAGPENGGNALSGSKGKAAVQQVRQEDKHGRNEPCPCGSGKKYKKCCFDK